MKPMMLSTLQKKKNTLKIGYCMYVHSVRMLQIRSIAQKCFASQQCLLLTPRQHKQYGKAVAKIAYD